MSGRQGRHGTGGASKGFSLLIVFCLVLAPAVQAQEARSIPPVLARAIRASASLRFSGRRLVTVLKDGRTDRHEEIVVRDGTLTRIQFPPEGAYAGQVIVETAKERRHFLPASNEVRVLPPRRDEALQRLRALARSGRIETATGERIAGYATIEVTVRDPDGNPIQRLSIEPKSGLLLRRRVFDATGVEVGGFTYTKVDLSPAPFAASLFKIDRKGVRTTTPWDALRRLARRDGYQAVGLPESTGFRLDSVRVAKEGPFFLQQYFGPNDRRLLFCQFRGSVNPDRLRRLSNRLNNLSWTSGDLTFVLLGPQDDATLVKLRGSIGPR